MLVALAVIVAISAITAFPVMWMWNGVVVGIWGVPKLSWLWAFQLILLIEFLKPGTTGVNAKGK